MYENDSDVLNAQVHRLGHRRHGHAEYHVVAYLGDQPRTCRSAVHPPRPHKAE